MNNKIVLKPERDKSVLRGHPWIFSGGIQSIQGSPKEGDWISAYNSEGKFLCSGHYGEQSIALRVLGTSESKAEKAEVEEKILKAFELRKNLGLVNNQETNCYRLIHAEGDGLPGLVVDVYNKAVVIQAHSLGMLRIAELIKNKIDELLSPDTIYLRNSFGEKNAESFFLKGENREIEILENGMSYFVDIVQGQKTGFFIDQRDNRKIVSEYSENKKVLNCFSYTGGFSVAALKGGAKSVTSADISATAIELLDKNIELNNFKNHNSIKIDCFKYLNETADKFDLIVLDPPSLAKHRGASKQAVKAYAALNLSALSKIEKEGFLFTYSCSQFVSKQEFESAVMDAAIKSNRGVKIIKTLSAAPCHARSIFHPEGEYLKGLMLRVG